MRHRLPLFGSFVLLAACGGTQRPAPFGEPVAVTIPSAPDAGAKPPAVDPMAMASAAPVASAPVEQEEPKRDRPLRGKGGDHFDRAAVADALSQVDPSICAIPGGPHGRGHIQITFHPSGNVQSVRLDQPFFGTSSGGCVESLYTTITVPWFSGTPVTVSKSFVVP